MADDYITAHLRQLHVAALGQRRQRVTSQHWERFPALAGRTLDEASRIVTDAYHADHNRVAAALIAAHRARPGQPTGAEMVLLLGAARPLVLMLDPTDRHSDSRASVWSSVACRIAHLDPDEVSTSPVPFLVALLGRIRPDSAKHPSEPRPQTFRSLVDFDAFAERRAMREHDTADRAIARVYLDAASRQHGFGLVAEYTLRSQPSRLARSTISRHRRRIAEDIGYVA